MAFVECGGLGFESLRTYASLTAAIDSLNCVFPGGAKGIRTPDPHTASVERAVLLSIAASTGGGYVQVRQ